MFGGPRPSRGQDLRSIAHPNGFIEQVTNQTTTLLMGVAAAHDE